MEARVAGSMMALVHCSIGSVVVGAGWLVSSWMVRIWCISSRWFGWRFLVGYRCFVGVVLLSWVAGLCCDCWTGTLGTSGAFVRGTLGSAVCSCCVCCWKMAVSVLRALSCASPIGANGVIGVGCLIAAMRSLAAWMAMSLAERWGTVVCVSYSHPTRPDK